MRANKSVMEVIGSLLNDGQIDAAKTVINACSKNSRLPLVKPVKQQVSESEKDSLIQKDIQKLRGYIGNDKNPVFASVELDSSEGDSYIIRATTANGIAKTKLREVVNQNTVKCSNGQILTLA
jgi:hypothetical protein